MDFFLLTKRLPVEMLVIRMRFVGWGGGILEETGNANSSELCSVARGAGAEQFIRIFRLSDMKGLFCWSPLFFFFL